MGCRLRVCTGLDGSYIREQYLRGKLRVGRALEAVHGQRPDTVSGCGFPPRYHVHVRGVGGVTGFSSAQSVTGLTDPGLLNG